MIFLPKDGQNCQKNAVTAYSEETAIPLILLSGAELTEYYSIHSGIRIGPKRTSVFSGRNSPKRMHP